MEYTKMVYKGRERLIRGQLKDFKDLPESVQENFIKIKTIIHELIGRELNMYVFGSYKNGNWDEQSDYDIAINENIDNLSINSMILERTGLKTDVFASERIIGYILIP